MVEKTQEQHTAAKGKVGTFISTTWVSIEYVSVRIAEALAENFRIIRSETNLFLGVTLFLLGLLNWSIGKFCDGNSADYLSCTRPTTYYYYGSFEIILILLGVVLVLIWLVKKRKVR